MTKKETTETDSLLRAVAAAPPRVALVRQVSAILLAPVDGAGDFARVDSVVAGFGLQLRPRPGHGFVALTTDVMQAASCALALRDTDPSARVVVTTAPVEEMAIERAGALIKDTSAGTIRLDGPTGKLLSGSFAIEVERSGGVLVTKRNSARKGPTGSGEDRVAADRDDSAASRRSRGSTLKRAFVAFATLKVAFAAVAIFGVMIAAERWQRGPQEQTGVPAVEDLRYLLDPGASAGAPEVAMMPEGRFVKVKGHRANFGFTRDAVWLKFRLSNRTAQPIDLVLYATRDWVEEVDLYEPGVGQLAHSGVHVPLLARPIHTEDIAFRVSLAPKQTRTLMLRMRGATPISFAGEVREQLDFDNFEARDALLFGGFYAVMLGLAAYSLILFVMLRERVQLWTGLAQACYALAEATSHGHVSRLIPAGAGIFEIKGGALAFGAWLVAGPTLLRDRLQLRQWTPRVDRVVKWTAVTCGLLAVVPLVWPQWYRLVFVAASLSIVPTMVAFVWCPKNRTAWYYIIASSCLTLPGSLSIAVLFGNLPAYPALEYGNHVGAVVSCLLYSLLVADAIGQQRARIRDLHASTLTLNTQLAVSNEELRFQVAERSRELANVLVKQSGAVAAAAVSPGETFEERYRVIREVGQGGFGSVYEVERRSDGRCLALKVLTHARSGSDAARVAREAEIGARLTHPNVVSIVDVGVARGISPFVVMEFLRGGSLEGRRQQFGDVAWALPLLRGIAAGLHALHTAKVVHRDLKPANVLLDDSVTPEVPKVSDFGISAFESATHRGHPLDGMAATLDARQVSVRLTRADALIGTPAYMAPEAAKGANLVTGAADVFAFGLLAFEMLTGAQAFDHDLPVFAALDGRPHPKARSIVGTTGVPRALAACLEACLQEDPPRRPTIQQVMVVLEQMD